MSELIDIRSTDELRHPGSRRLINADGTLQVEIMDPHAEDRYSNEVRFSPVAFILDAQYRGASYLYNPPRPLNPFAPGAGLAMEFDLGERIEPPGYAEAKEGEAFLKVGVGILERDIKDEYKFAHPYPIIELAKTTVDWELNKAHFIQTLEGNAQGYAYAFEETVELLADKLLLSYKLTNTGSKSFSTEQYIHNFLCFNGQNTKSGYQVSFPYDFSITASNGTTPKNLPTGVFQKENALITDFEEEHNVKPFVRSALNGKSPHSIQIQNPNAKQKLTIETSLPSELVSVFVTKEQVSPEVNLMLELAPEESINFTRSYVFA